MSEEKWHGYICYSDDGVTLFMWSINGLWQHARSLPVEMLPLSALPTLDETLTLTKREMAHEAKRIMEADLDYPIIIASQDWLMDGSHRVMKAHVLGLTEIKAVRFVQNPDPDLIKPVSEVQTT